VSFIALLTNHYVFHFMAGVVAQWIERQSLAGSLSLVVDM